MTIKKIKERTNFSNAERKVFRLLSLFGKYKVVGTGGISEIEYNDDFDLMEYTKCPDEQKAYEQILKIFQQKFKDVYKEKDMYITDFKAGHLPGGIPLRWNKETIAQGYQYIEDRKIDFISCLNQKSVIKMDIVSIINGNFIEFSEIYFISFGEHDAYPVNFKIRDQIITNIKLDYFKKLKEDNYFKALKRLFSFLKLEDNEHTEIGHILIDFFNSPIGHLSALTGDMKTLKETVFNKFKRVEMKKIKKALENIIEKLPQKYIIYIRSILRENTKKDLIDKLEIVIKFFQDLVNIHTKNFIKNNKELKKIIHI